MIATLFQLMGYFILYTIIGIAVIFLCVYIEVKNYSSDRSLRVEELWFIYVWPIMLIHMIVEYPTIMGSKKLLALFDKAKELGIKHRK